MPKSSPTTPAQALFASEQPDMLEKSYEEERASQAAKPVECLGQTFPNDAARRDHYLGLLAEKLKDPEFRKIEGFPEGKDEDILALSDPPYYTACPNPWLSDFVKQHGTPYHGGTPYSREPYVADVSEGKKHALYGMHSYHTKVPHRAIMRYILHYTEPGDLVFDGFCGTGMTGVAAQLCGDRAEVQELGYRIREDGTVLDEEGRPFSKIGPRKAILNDLSPAATFIAHNYNAPVAQKSFQMEAEKCLSELDSALGWTYTTLTNSTNEEDNLAAEAIMRCSTLVEAQKLLESSESLRAAIGSTNQKLKLEEVAFTIWSDIFVCPECNNEIVFWNEVADLSTNTIRASFACPHCQIQLTKRDLNRAFSTSVDIVSGNAWKTAKRQPVLIETVGNPAGFKKPGAFDYALIAFLERFTPSGWFPHSRMMEGGETRRNDQIGVTHLHHFYNRRTLLLLAWYYARVEGHSQFTKLLSIMTGGLLGLTLLQRYRPGSTFPNMILSGTLYIGSIQREWNASRWLSGKLRGMMRSPAIQQKTAIISTCDFSSLPIAQESLDYIFLDPPFGANLAYSELNSIWEGWLKLATRAENDAVENAAQGKSSAFYRKSIASCFKVAYSMLKPGRWMTVEFSNTSAGVWNIIQSTLQEAGFVVANVAVLDKKQKSFKAVTSPTAVKQDLVISAYKPNGGLEDRFARVSEQPQGCWEFVRSHLKYLPVVKQAGGEMEFIAERDPRIIFDRMVAFYFQHGVDVPMNSAEFQAGLEQNFIGRDGMIFLPEQATEYDRRKLLSKGLGQRSLLVDDERSAIDWLTEFLKRRPSESSDIAPEFMEQLRESTWKKGELRPELSALLRMNFLRYDGSGDVPSQIHSYLSTNFPEMRNKEKSDPALKAKAKDRWYVPDPNNAIQIEQMRERDLLRDFDTYLASKERKIKEFRIEALRAGFKKAWQDKRYDTIIAVAAKIPETVIQEDPKLLMWHTNACTRAGVDL